MAVPYLVESLASTPGLLRAAMERLGHGNLDRPTHPGRFSPREVAAHLADWEPIFLARMEQGVAQPGSRVAVYDEGARATELGYSTWDTAASLASWAGARAQTVAWLQSLQEPQWNLEFNHPERGMFSVMRQASMLLAHDIYHLVQLEEAARS